MNTRAYFTDICGCLSVLIFWTMRPPSCPATIAHRQTAWNKQNIHSGMSMHTIPEKKVHPLVDHHRHKSRGWRGPHPCPGWLGITALAGLER